MYHLVKSLVFVQIPLPVALFFLLMSLVRLMLNNRYMTKKWQQRMASVINFDLGLYLCATDRHLLLNLLRFPTGQWLEGLFGIAH